LPALCLTFDDGPAPSTGPLLDTLRRHGARATFFLVGKNLEGFALGDRGAARALALRALLEGHRLGNHGFSHARDPLPDRALRDEFLRTDALLTTLYHEAGVPAPWTFPCRLPYGPQVRPGPDGPRLDERLAVLASLGRTHTHWTALFDDWEPDTCARDLTERLVLHTHTLWGEVCMPVPVLHDGGTRMRVNGVDRSATVAAVGALCEALGSRARWEVVS
jgi:chitin deacetylase